MAGGSRRLDDAGRLVAQGVKEAQQLLHGHPIPRSEGSDPGPELGRADGLLEQGAGGGDDEGVRSAGCRIHERRQDIHPLAGRLHVPGDPLVGEGFGGGEEEDGLRVGGEGPQLVVELAGAFRVGSDEEGGAGQVPVQGGGEGGPDCPQEPQGLPALGPRLQPLDQLAVAGRPLDEGQQARQVQAGHEITSNTRRDRS